MRTMRGRRTVKGLAIAGVAVWLFSESQKHKELAALPEPPAAVPPPARQGEAPGVQWTPAAPVRSWRRRTATTLVFTALFFAGAALSAGAGNELAHVDAGSTDAAVVDAATTDTTTTDVTTDATTDAAKSTD